MTKALDGEHYCKDHQGNHSHYDPKNCKVCRLETTLRGIATFDCYTREDEEPPAEAMRRMAKEGLKNDISRVPQQAHGDALAEAISICEGAPAQDAYIAGKQRAVWGRWVDADALLPLLRQALTASSVPYVPEEVRRLPDRMDREADARDDGDFISDHARGIADASRHWAEALRGALASEPAEGLDRE